MNATSARSPLLPKAVRAELNEIVGSQHVLVTQMGRYVSDESETSGLRGYAAAVVMPESTEEVQRVAACLGTCGIAMIPRGGGTGYAGGAVPQGGVVIALERMDRVRSFDPLLWRIEVEAGVTTGRVHALARENGLLYPPDPGAAATSQIGGNIATNAGGPHSFKYGTTGRWMTGVECVLANGDLARVGGPIRKDVAGYDIKNLIVGSEGTLAIITSAWLRLVPAPEISLPLVAFFDSISAGCTAIEAILGCGLEVAALEFLDVLTFGLARHTYPGTSPAIPQMTLIVDIHGSSGDAHTMHAETIEVLREQGATIHAPAAPGQVSDLWHWREGVSGIVTAARGGKLSEDIVVPIDRLAEAIEGTTAIGETHGLQACSWGHAGDGNVHSTLLLDPDSQSERERAHAAAEEFFELARCLGGSVSGEHGVGVLKAGQLRRQWNPATVGLHEAIKHAFDPLQLLNPGKKQA